MNRDELKARLAKSLEDSAIKAHVFHVDLAGGDRLSLRKLSNEEAHRAAIAASDQIDLIIRSMQYSVVDDEGSQLLESLDEAHALYNSFDPADFDTMAEAMRLMTPVDDAGAVEAGKAS